MYMGTARRLGQVVLPMGPVRLGQSRRRMRLGQEEWFTTVEPAPDTSVLEAVTMPETVIPAVDQSAWAFTGPTYQGSLESPTTAAPTVGTPEATSWFGDVASIFGKVLSIVPAVLPAVVPVLQAKGVIPRTTTAPRAAAPPGYGYTASGQVVKVPTGYTVNAAGQIIPAPSAASTWLWPVLIGGGVLAGLAYMSTGTRRS